MSIVHIDFGGGEPPVIPGDSGRYDQAGPAREALRAVGRCMEAAESTPGILVERWAVGPKHQREVLLVVSQGRWDLYRPIAHSDDRDIEASEVLLELNAYATGRERG